MAQPVRLERCAPNGIKAIFLFPYFGVATMIGIPGRRSAYNRGGELVYTSISLHLSHTLIRHSLPTLIMCIAGVPEVQSPIVFDCTARVYSMTVKIPVRF